MTEIKGIGEKVNNEILHYLEFLADVLLCDVKKDEIDVKFSTNDKYICYVVVTDI